MRTAPGPITGQWSFEDGALLGRERLQERRPACCAAIVRQSDAAIEIAVKLTGAKSASVELDSHTSDPSDYIAQLVIEPNGVSIRVCDQQAAAGRGEADVSVLSVKRTIPENAWHSFVWEIRGSETALTMNGQLVDRGSHMRLSQQKDCLSLHVAGDSAAFRDVHVWNISP